MAALVEIFAGGSIRDPQRWLAASVALRSRPDASGALTAFDTAVMAHLKGLFPEHDKPTVFALHSKWFERAVASCASGTDALFEVLVARYRAFLTRTRASLA